MARIAGVDLPRNKRVEIALTYIAGIGPARSQEVLKQINIEPSTRTEKLTEDQVGKIRKYIEANYAVEGDLRRQVNSNIKRLMDLGSYRGLRHRRGLPVRGQRTSTNARTRKGPKGRQVAGKKKATKK